MNNKGIIISIIVLVLLGGGVYFLMSQNNSIPVNPNAENNSGTPFVPTANNNQPPTSTYTPPAVFNSNTSVTVPTPTLSVTHSISIQGYNFSPSNLTVKKGDTVMWTNYNSIPHSATGDNGGPNSGTINPNQSYSYTFNNIGSFPYHCTFDSSMTGKVTVTS